MAMKKLMYGKMPLFYQEVLSAWAEVIENIQFECENKLSFKTTNIFKSKN